MIDLLNITKTYDRTVAVRDVTCSVRGGEIFGLLGPNGAGKTTTIKMMTGLIRPTEGRILIAGHDVMDAPLQAKSAFGYVSDKSAFHEKLSGKELLLFVASIFGIKKDDAFRRADAMLDLVGIADEKDELIENYSHGMRQRLSFAAALVHEPQALIIDEPFVGLDPYGVRLITGLLGDLAQRGVTVFLATHSLHIAQDLCDRAGIMHRGKLVSIIERKDFSGEGNTLEERFITLTS